jgi:hypothetical protein
MHCLPNKPVSRNTPGFSGHAAGMAMEELLLLLLLRFISTPEAQIRGDLHCGRK